MKNFVPDGYSPEAAVKKFFQIAENSLNIKTSHISVSNHHNGWGMSWESDLYTDDILETGEILYPKNCKLDTLIFNQMSLKLNANQRTITTDDNNRINISDLKLDNKGSPLPTRHQKELEEIKKRFVDYGFIQDESDVGLIITKVDSPNLQHYTKIYLTLPANKISFKRPLQLSKQYEEYEKASELLNNILDENIGEEKHSIKIIRPTTPTASMFVNLLLDKEHFAIFSKFKHFEDYAINIAENKGDYPPYSEDREWINSRSSLGGMINGELKFTEEKSYGTEASSEEKKIIRAGYNKLFNLKDDTTIVEVLLDGRKLGKLQEDLLVLKLERAFKELKDTNPDRVKELLAQLSRDSKNRS